MNIIDKYITSKKIKPNPHVKVLIDKYLDIKNGYSIDIGCGDGRNSFYLKDKYNFSCDLFDPDKTKVQIAKSNSLISAICCKAEDFNFIKNKYDAGLYINSAMYLSLDDQKDILNKIIISSKSHSLIIYSAMINWNNEKRNVLKDNEIVSLFENNNYVLKEKNNYSQGFKKFTIMAFQR